MRSLLITVVCGILWPSLIEWDWPEGDATWWAIYLGGLAVIAVGSVLAETWVARRSSAAADATESSGDPRER